MSSPSPADDDALVAKPVFSILVPSYNSGSFFEPAMRSAVEQMGPDDELLIQDAGSTDGTQDVIAALVAENSNVKPVIGPDGGQSDALNRALARAGPSWVVWLNSDDILLPGSLDALRKAIPAHPEADLFYGGNGLLRMDGSTVDKFPGRAMEMRKLLRLGITSFSGSIVMRDHTLRKLGGIKAELNCAMDYDLQMRIAQSDLVQVNVPVPIGALRFHEGSKSANLWKGFIRESYHIRMDYSRTPTEKLYGLWGSAWHLAEVPVFRMRLSPAYRKFRRRLPALLR